MGLIHADFGAVFTLSLHSGEEFSPFRDKEAGLRAGWSGVTRNPVIMIGIFLMENFQEALTGEHIDPPSFRVVEKVVRATCNLTRRDLLASFSIKDEQSWGYPASHKQPVISFVERPREICFCRCDGPAG